MGEVKVKKVNTFVLPNEKIIVKFIKRRRGMASGEHIGEDHVISGGMLNGSSKRFTAPLARNGSIFNVLTNDEKEYLEKVTQLNLSTYGDYWRDFYVTLRKEDNRFDLSNPIDYMSYKVLLSLKDHIAPSWQDRTNKLTYQFVITRDNEVLAETNKKFSMKKQAFKLYGKIEDDKAKLLGVLKLLSNKPISSTSSLDWLRSKVEEFVDNKAKQFVNLLQNDSFHTMLLINSGVEVGVIQKQGNRYSTTDGLDLCEAGSLPTYDNAIAYLDNPKNQDVRALIDAKIDNTK